MVDTPDIASVARVVGDPTRCRMLAALMHGQALTATELALEGDVTASTASSHLARMVAAGIVTGIDQGRHRYFRIAAPEVAAVLEALTRLAGSGGPRRARPGPSEPGLRRARVCYDHLAGERAVRLLERMRGRDLLSGPDDALTLTNRGESWCARIGIDLAALRSRRRPLSLACLDWSERRLHLAGALGGAILELLFARRLARRERGSRAVVLSPRGEAFVEHPQAAS